MLTAVTGASGLVGGNLCTLLLSSGHTVRATRRPSTNASHLASLPIEWVDAPLDDVAALTAAFREVDVVYHCAAQVGVEGSVTPALTRANVDGTRNVVDAVRASGARRLVHVSSTAAVGLSTDGVPCTEESAWNFAGYGLADGYTITKRRAEDLVRAAVAEGLDAVIVNPTFMFGPLDAKPSSGQLIVDVARGKVPALTPGKNNFVDVRDVARGMMLAAEKGRPGDRYILGADNLTYEEITKRIAAAAGVKAPTWHVPYALSLPLGWVGDLRAALGGRPLITSTTIRYAYTERFVFSADKARRELGYTTGPIDDAIRDALAWFRGAGMLAPVRA